MLEMLSESKNKGITIVICCFNSAARLPETLRYLSKQRLDSYIPWEVIIVNNNSTDNTRQVAENTWEKLNTQKNLLILDEPLAGLSYAREKGFMAAKYNYIVLCDDDNWLDENYLQIAFNLMESDGKIGALGGQSEEVCEVEPPFWFNDLKISYAIGKQNPISGDVTNSRGYLWGAGLVIRKEVWMQLRRRNFESILSDRKGKTIASGGDGEICYAIRLLGYKLYYEEGLKFKHFMTKGRLTWGYYIKLLRSFGRARVYLGMYDYVIKKRKGSAISPQRYWQINLKTHLRVLYHSHWPMLKGLLNTNAVNYSIIDGQMKLGGVVELLKTRFTYQAYIRQIETTFSENI